MLVHITDGAIFEPSNKNAATINTALTALPPICAISNFAIVGMLLFASKPQIKPYEANSIIINGSIYTLGIPVSAKLISGASAPETKPTVPPPSSPAASIAMCMGKNVSPSAVPIFDTSPIICSSCGNATAAMIAPIVASVLVLTVLKTIVDLIAFSI